jgi:hypothetical protein
MTEAQIIRREQRFTGRLGKRPRRRRHHSSLRRTEKYSSTPPFWPYRSANLTPNGRWTSHISSRKNRERPSARRFGVPSGPSPSHPRWSAIACSRPHRDRRRRAAERGPSRSLDNDRLSARVEGARVLDLKFTCDGSRPVLARLGTAGEREEQSQDQDHQEKGHDRRGRNRVVREIGRQGRRRRVTDVTRRVEARTERAASRSSPATLWRN